MQRLNKATTINIYVNISYVSNKNAGVEKFNINHVFRPQSYAINYRKKFTTTPYNINEFQRNLGTNSINVIDKCEGRDGGSKRVSRVFTI